MYLSDGTLRRLHAEEILRIEPTPEDDCWQPASIDLTLGSEFKGFRSTDEPYSPVTQSVHCYEVSPCGSSARTYWRKQFLDTRTPPIPEQLREWTVEEGKPFGLGPGRFVLGTTQERVGLPGWLLARIEGKSSLGRLGLMVHVTAGFIDPGFEGRVTLELANLSPLPILLWPGMKICQLSVAQLDQPALRPYGHPELKSRYQGQQGVTESRVGK